MTNPPHSEQETGGLCESCAEPLQNQTSGICIGCAMIATIQMIPAPEHGLCECPFCSSADVELRDKPFHYVACNNCGSRTGGGSEREAVEVWNTRPEASTTIRAQAAELERLRENLNGILDVSLRMNPDQSFNAQGRLARCAEYAEEALSGNKGMRA